MALRRRFCKLVGVGDVGGTPMSNRERNAIRTLFTKLRRSRLEKFPEPHGRLKASDKQGVYIIYDPRGKVLHVGRTPSGAGGIRQRLGNHLHNASSFTNKYLKGHGEKLRGTHSYRCSVVENQRRRALLEAYAIGYLCPAHIGLGLPPLSQSK
jgi:hypothetical protein